LQEKFSNGQIDDLSFFLSEPWADLLYQDAFDDLRAKLNAFVKDGSAAGKDMQELSGQVRSQVMKFLTVHAAQLPAYHLNLNPASNVA
jgi:hypothetical protein